METIVQRWLRGTGARGLAALAAPSASVRPLLAVHRAALRAYCEHRGLPFVDDPANEDRRHLRVRLRLDLLPLYEQLQPGFADAMRAIGARAARWRAEVDAWAATFPWQVVALGVGRIDRARVQPLSNEALQLLWPAWCATVGVVLDGPGTTRLVRFTTGDAPAGELQVANGASVVRRGRWLEVRNASVTADYRAAREQCALQVRVGDVWTWPGWRFEPISAQGGETRDHATPETAAQWAAFPRDAVVTLRRWQEGDHVHGAPDGASRGVSRYLSEAGIPRRDRRGWPVIVLDGTVEWVPEVCRGIRAAPSRSGRSDFVWYRCVRAHP
jgi:tRNA(Ile)-lysidine synthase